jgi:hypothetical protein
MANERPSANRSSSAVGPAAENALVAAKIKRASELVTLAEQARIAALAGSDADDALRALARAERLAADAVAAIGYFNF